jgi:hypothetical protein
VRFSGEIKFPEIDHPGVPVQFVIEGRQTELIVEGESLGRWSLYDVHARRLVASAFQIDLNGVEITFVADDPIDFAYRGVEHMAETWASMKSKQVGRRMVMVRKSRKGTLPSRIGELRAAMEANLEVQSRPLAGEPAVPSGAPSPDPVLDRQDEGDWDPRDDDGAIPLVGKHETGDAEPTQEETADVQPTQEETADAALEARLAQEMERFEEERQRIAEERARLDAERLEAEQREAVRIEAYRLEMQRLEAEREELRAQAAAAAQRAEEIAAARVEPEQATAAEATPGPAPAHEVEGVTDDSEWVAVEPEPVGEEPGSEEVLPVDEAASPVEEAPVSVPDEPPSVSELSERESKEDSAGEVVDLSDLEEDDGGTEADETPTEPTPEPQPALAGVAPTRERGGLRGAVRAAFARGTKEHDHQFIVAPGGIGITRYVCEICGYVSISVED